MRDISDLKNRLREEGVRIRAVRALVRGEPVDIPPDQARARRVELVTDYGVTLQGGKIMPFGCAGHFEFDGSPDRFCIHIGEATLCYEIAKGEA